MVLVVASAVLAWLAVGALADEESDGSGSAELISLAESTAALADQLQLSLSGLSVGTASASEAMSHTVAISANVRTILKSLEDVPDADAIAGQLGNAEASLLETQGGLDEAGETLRTSEADLTAVVESLRSLPDQLRDVLSDDTTSDAHNDLAKAAIAAAGLALMIALGALEAQMREAATRQP